MCPKCGKEVKLINGIYVCSEGHISTADQIKKPVDIFDPYGGIFGDFFGDMFKEKEK